MNLKDLLSSAWLYQKLVWAQMSKFYISGSAFYIGCLTAAAAKRCFTCLPPFSLGTEGVVEAVVVSSIISGALSHGSAGKVEGHIGHSLVRIFSCHHFD